ncbi:Long-chain-fatty-acid--CoA ligase ACSBG1 [Myotis brandtii]|uniref:Long-chain-fatty-acid--CoA ligase ACSBG1 n=1 Tax=Myotis brandtii TaxID=109478 RepID=S7N9F0_MYOBR|nr:Long-chain-fatty-acid--CoA ligase ACSBG1 [Myotis brandtii]
MLPVAGHTPPAAMPLEVTPWPSAMGVPWLVWKTRSHVRPDSDHRAQGPSCVHCQQTAPPADLPEGPGRSHSRCRDQGSWERITYAQYYLQARQAAKGFLKPLVPCRGIVTGIYTTSSPEACQYIARDCRANIIVVDAQKQLEKILKIWENLPHLKAVVMYGEPPVEKVANVYTMEDLMELGGQVPEEDLDAILSTQQPNQCCALVYTSGTTGSPKGVMLSQDNITWTARYGSQAGGIQPAEVQQEVVVSYLPLSHIAAQIYDLWTGIQWGAQVCFAQPDALKIMERIQEVAAQSGFIRRKMLLWAMSVMLEHNLTCPSSSVCFLARNICAPIDLKPFAARLADYLVLAKVRQALGFAKCRKSFYGAAPMTAETQRFFLGLNIRLYSGYGLSETSGPHFMSSPCNFRLYSSGKVVPGCRAKLVNQDAEGIGEICMWGRTVFMGYLNMEDKTREAIDADGWLHSGDLGRLDGDGFLYITGRLKELIITAGGENVPPLPIEEAVKTELPLVSSAVLIGDQRKFLSMLLTLKVGPTGPRHSRVHTVHAGSGLGSGTGSRPPGRFLCPRGLWAAAGCWDSHPLSRRGSSCWMRQELRALLSVMVSLRVTPAVYRAIEEGIRRVNGNAAARPYHIQKWAILERDFSISGGELGPTMKLKRLAVLEKYRDVIDSFYLE